MYDPLILPKVRAMNDESHQNLEPHPSG